MCNLLCSIMVDVLEKLGSGSLFWFPFCCCDQCSNLKGLFKLMSPVYSLSPRTGSWGRRLEQKPWRKAAYWLALCLLPLAHAQLVFLCNPVPPAQGGTALSGLSIRQDDHDHTWPQASLICPHHFSSQGLSVMWS